MTCRTCRHDRVCRLAIDGCPSHDPLRLYIIGAFTSPTRLGEQLNVAAAIKTWDALTDAGYHAFCPQAASGPLEAWTKRDPAFWYRWTMREMRRSDACVLVPDDGCHTPLAESDGSRDEIAEAGRLGMRVYALEELV